MYLIYDKLNDTEKNLDEIYTNMLEEYAEKNEGYIYDKIQKKKIKAKDVLRENKKYSPFVILGKNYKTKIENLDSGYTFAWCIPIELTDGRWAIVKPTNEAYMKNVDEADESLDSISHLLDNKEGSGE